MPKYIARPEKEILEDIKEAEADMARLNRDDREMRHAYWTLREELLIVAKALKGGAEDKQTLLDLTADYEKMVGKEMNFRGRANTLNTALWMAKERIDKLDRELAASTDWHQRQAEEKRLRKEASRIKRRASGIKAARTRAQRKDAAKRFWATFVTDAMAADQYAREAEGI